MHGTTNDRPRRAARHRLTAVPVLVATALLLSGCGNTDAAPPENKPEQKTEQKSENPTTTTSSKPAPHYTVEQLAAKLGCTATFRAPTKGFRQGSCTKDGKPFVLLDFENVENQDVWLENAISFGGIFLVGDRWALSGVSKEYLESLCKTLGGTVQDKESYGS